MGPKSIKNPSKINPSKIHPKSGSRAGPFWRPFFDQKSQKVDPRSPKGAESPEKGHPKNHAKNDAGKEAESMAKGSQKDAKMEAQIMDFSYPGIDTEKT